MGGNCRFFRGCKRKRRKTKWPTVIYAKPEQNEMELSIKKIHIHRDYVAFDEKKGQTLSG